MSAGWMEFRMYCAELLLALAVTVADKTHPDCGRLLHHIRDYLRGR